MRRKSEVVVIILIGLLIGVWGVVSLRPASAQQPATATPGGVILPSATHTPEPPEATATRTATSAGPALVEAKGPDVNVRAGPDINEDRLGTIQPGERYVVFARRFEWLQIEFPNTPSRIGWVHESVVNVIGDVAQIPEIGVDELPTTDPVIEAEEQTLDAATLTPGGLITLTAQSLITPEGFFTVTPDTQERTLAPGERLPTFTFPPFTNTPVPVQDLQGGDQIGGDTASGFPIAIPVIGLVALGLMGLLVGIFRRL